MENAKKLLEFIEKSPSMFHCVNEIKNMALTAGYTEKKENEDWNFGSGKYFVSRNDSSAALIDIPKGDIKGFHVVASHSDSPCYKVKENPDISVEGHYRRINVEKYGGMIINSWLDRPLSVAGRVVVDGKEGLERHLVNISEDLMVIPNLAIHMNRDVNKGYEYHVQKDMCPLTCSIPEGKKLVEIVSDRTGIPGENILGEDLFLYVRDRGRIIGSERDMILSPKLDDLECVYSSVRAIIESEAKSYINICIVFDNEEVGSGTSQGADSTFFTDILNEIKKGICIDECELRKMIANSLLISADNAHAVHPAYPEKSDPTNRPYINGGVVIKYHGGQKYTTDGRTGAMIKAMCKRAGVPYQTFANHSDSAGGSTLGNISTAHVSMPSVDIGLPQLAMHSAVETAGVRDLGYLIKLLKEFYQ